MSGSKTKYYVSSSTFPLFDRDKVVDQFQSAVIDQVTNSSIELSEYLKNHYRNTELWNFRRFISWCKTSGYNNHLGSIESVFYSNPTISNTLVTEAIKHLYTLGEKDTFQVNSTNLNYFNSDYWLRYLATQQGKADLFGSSDEDYTVDYPTEESIRATFNTGEIVEGPLPEFTSGTRFLEISWSIDKVTEREVYPKEDTSGSEPIIVTDHTYEYGFYVYQEGTGIPALDVIMVNNNIKADYTFYPVIPIRTNTAWLGKTGQDYVGKALKQLSIMSSKTGDNAAYWELANSLVKGMTQGSMGDIDYITLIPGININTRDKASQRYLFEFFYKIYLNSALAHGEAPAALSGGRITYNGHNYISTSSKKLKKLFADSNYTRNFYRSFNVSNPTSNLNLTYDWAGADFYENNGKWKPNAKPDDYGVLAGKYIYKWTTIEPLLDSEGNTVYSGNEYDGYEIVYHEVEHTTDFNLTFFCHQESVNRWKAVAFVDLYLRNLVYHGKYVETSAYDAVKDSGRTGSVVQDFSSDFNENGEDLDTSLKIFTMEYVENPGDSDSAFIVPLELTTFRDVGVVNQYQIIKICSYLVYNCWVKKKVKWYQRGFFSVVMSALGVVAGSLLLYIAPTIATITISYFATMLAMTMAAWAMNVALALCQKIFGEARGTALFNFVHEKLLGVICAILVYCFGYIGMIVAAAIQFGVASGSALNNGESQWSAFKKGFKAGAISAAGSYVGGAAGEYVNGAFQISSSALQTAIQAGASAAAYAATTTFLNGVLDGGSFKATLKNTFLNAAISGVTAFAGSYASSLFKGTFSIGGSSNQLGSSVGTTEASTQQTLGNSFSQVLMETVVKNPMTYINLINMAQEVRYATKLQNLESDFQEFNNELESATKLLNTLKAQQFNMYTAQETIRLQSCAGRLLTMFPEANMGLSWDNFVTLALATGLDHCKTVLGSTIAFVENSLTLDGYSPYQLFFVQDSYTLSWDND